MNPLKSLISGIFGSNRPSFPIESTDYDRHTARCGGPEEYDVYKLIHLASSLPSATVKTHVLMKDNLGRKCWTDQHGWRVSPKKILKAYQRCHGSWETVLRRHPAWKQHVSKILSADYRFPVLMHKGRIVDGMHRVAHAFIDNVPTLQAKVFDTLPAKARYYNDNILN